ncbi:MAG: sulfotransferase family protein [Marinovum sp.]|nr:sulfotransferase family protein [Marinovum sp.]
MPITVKAHQIAYSPLPKAGCSTVKRMMATVDPTCDLPPQDTWDEHLWHRLFPTIRYRADRFSKALGYWRICVVRDPLKRLLSVYTNRVVKFRDLHNSANMKRPEYAHLSKDPDPDFFFSHLQEYRDASSVIKHHILPAELFLGPDLEAYDRVYRTEEMPQLAHDLQKRTGVAVKCARENASAMQLDVHDLKSETVDMLRPRLAREYQYLEKFFGNPLA